jgi:uncharacterized protein (TIGR04255 family)
MSLDALIATSKLPNAPLAEVVFEMRWELEGDASIPIPFKTDPGYYVMADSFAELVAQLGFGYAKRLSDDSQVAPHSIAWRYYRNQEQPFPLWQIGPGILAVNESSSYEWVTYKKLCLDAFKVLKKCYPKMRRFDLKPFYLELRYIDSFGLDEKTNESLIDFLNKNTSLNVSLPFFISGKLQSIANGQLTLSFPVKGMGETLFVIAIGSGLSQGIKSVIMESKIITKLGKSDIEQGQTVKGLSQWLESAHDISSPFFKEFIKDQLMKKFSGS